MRLLTRRPAETPAAPRRTLWQALTGHRPNRAEPTPAALVEHALLSAMPGGTTAMDSVPGFKLAAMGESAAASPEIVGFFAGHALPLPDNICAMLSTHWLIDKACRMPARDAIRQGWILDVDDDQLLRRIQRADKAMRTARALEQFVHLGRVFGRRVLMFQVESTNPRFYEYPFNLDGVTPGSYKGFVQVDPQWCVPELDNANMEPSRPGFYEPTHWRVGNLRVHRSHLMIFRNGELPDMLKPAYGYGGVSVPQRVLERVYSAERTANEAHELAMTKRVSTLSVDLAEAEASGGMFEAKLAAWRRYLDNFGVKLLGPDDQYQQHDTSLADFDAVVMNAYQLVAAAANVPATKLLGTTPKGFNATGEYEQASYHEELESIQAHDLDPVLDRHYQLLMRSWGVDATVDHTWEALDTPTAKEYAEIELIRAQTDAALMQTGAIDGEDIRDRIRRDRDGSYFGLEEGVLEDPPLEE